MASGDSINVTARIWHTENGVAHAEGETYAVTDRALAETLRGIGFVSIEGWTEEPAPPATATGATAGVPGTWTPAGSTAPADLAACGAVVATRRRPLDGRAHGAWRRLERDGTAPWAGTWRRRCAIASGAGS